MADNFTRNKSFGPDTVTGYTEAADDVASVWYPIVKLAFGALDSVTLVSGAAGFPIDIVGNTAGVGGGTAYTEDAAAAADPVAPTLMLIRRDTPSITEVSADGDNVAAKASSTGAQYVEVLSGAAKIGGDATNGLDVDVTRVTGTVTIAGAVTNAGTFATQVDGAALTSLQLIDDVVHSGDAVLSKYAVMGAVLDDVATGAVTENQANALRMSSRRALLVEGVASGTALGVSVASGGVASGAIASGAIASGAVASGAYASGSIGSGAIASGAIASGAIAAGAVAAGAYVSGSILSGALAAGALATGAITDMPVDDNVFTPATGRVMPAGFFADETSPDSVDEGDIGIARMTLDRFVRVVAEQTDTVRAGSTSRTPTATAIAATTSGNNTLVTNSNGGLKLRVYALAIVAAAAVSLYFTGDAGGTVVFGGSTNKISLAANGGFVLPYNPAGWFDCAANTDVVMNLSGTVVVSGGIVTAEV